jgi:hypothetical protein
MLMHDLYNGQGVAEVFFSIQQQRRPADLWLDTKKIINTE